MHCRLTEPLGMRIAEFPLNPMFAKMLLESGRRKKTDFLHSLVMSRGHCLHLHIEITKNTVSETYTRKCLIQNFVYSCPLLSGYHYIKLCCKDGKNKLGLLLSW